MSATLFFAQALNGIQLGVHGDDEPVQADGEDVQAAGGHRAAPQCALSTSAIPRPA